MRRLGLQIGQVHFPVRRVGHHHHRHARHRRAGRVGAVGGGRDQHHVALRLAARAMVGADDQQARELPLGAGVGLQRHRGKPGDGAQRRLHVAQDLCVALDLACRHEGVDAAEALPGHRQHLGGRIELHRARPERNHRRVEAEVLALEVADVPHHLRFRPVLVEDRVREERRRPDQRRRDRLGSGGAAANRPPRAAHRRGDVGHVLRRHPLVQGDAHMAVVEIPQVDARILGPLPHSGHTIGTLYAQRVEIGVVQLPQAGVRQRLVQRARVLVHPLGDLPQAVGPVVDGVHRRHVREQRLGRADVGRRLFAADVLLAGGERHPVGGAPVRVHRHADDAARGVADEILARGEEGRVRAAVPERDAEPLRVAERDVRTHLPGRRQQHQRQQVRGDRDPDAGRMRPLDDRPQIHDPAALVRVLRQQAERLVVEAQRVQRRDRDLEAERLGPRAQDVDGLGKRAIADQEAAPRRGPFRQRLHAVQQRHRFGGGGGLVEQRRVGDVHAGQIADHGLEIDQRLQPALGDLGLIRRVRRVPAGVLHHHPQDHAGGDGVVVAQADVRAEHPVARGQLGQPRQKEMLLLGARHVERFPEADAARHHLVDQRVERRHANRREHPGLIRRRRTDVTAGERAGGAGFDCGHRAS